MFYVPDGTGRAGYYECSSCGERFLSMKIGPSMVCPYCGEIPDMELGPDDVMPEIHEDARLLEMIEGEEEVAKYDQLLSLAITGGDYDWL